MWDWLSLLILILLRALWAFLFVDIALSKNSLEQALPPALPRPITEVGRLHIDSSVCYLGLAAPSTSLWVIFWSGFVWKILCKFLETFWESSRRCTSSHHSFGFIGRESWFHFVLRLLYRRPHALCTMLYTLFYFVLLCSTLFYFVPLCSTFFHFVLRLLYRRPNAPHSFGARDLMDITNPSFPDASKPFIQWNTRCHLNRWRWKYARAGSVLYELWCLSVLCSFLSCS